MNPVPKADIYHSVATGYSGIVGIYGKYQYGSSCIISEHGIYTREREEEIIKSSWIKSYHKDIWIKFFHSLSKCAYDNSDIVTSLFETNKELQIEFGCNEDKIKIIPNGVELKKYENLPTRQKDGGIKIGAIVRVVPIKDIRTMLLSFNLVKEQVENARLYIIGPEDEDEEYYNECLNLVQNLHIKDVFFTGSVNVLDYIWDMDILLLTSISEGQPLAVMEGMAARKPYVCTNVGHCKGLIYGDNDEFGRAGFIQYVMDYKGIAQSLIKLGNDEKLRNDMGICGYNRIKNLYTKEGFINEYRDLYNRYGGE